MVGEFIFCGLFRLGAKLWLQVWTHLENIWDPITQTTVRGRAGWYDDINCGTGEICPSIDIFPYLLYFRYFRSLHMLLSNNKQTCESKTENLLHQSKTEQNTTQAKQRQDKDGIVPKRGGTSVVWSNFGYIKSETRRQYFTNYAADGFWEGSEGRGLVTPVVSYIENLKNVEFKYLAIKCQDLDLTLSTTLLNIQIFCFSSENSGFGV